MVIDFNLPIPDNNAPRFLWRNDALTELDDSTLDTLLNEMTWNSDYIPTVINIELTDPIACNAIGIAGADWNGQTVFVEMDDTNSDDWIELGAWQPLPGQPFFRVFDFQTSAKWRITILGAAVQASVLKFGMALAMQRNIYGGHSPFSKVSQTEPRSQLGAHFVSKRIVVDRREQKFEFKNLTAPWYRAFFSELQSAAPNRSMFGAWRPHTYPLETIYGFCDGDIKPSNMGTKDYMSVSFSLEGSAT